MLKQLSVPILYPYIILISDLGKGTTSDLILTFLNTINNHTLEWN